MKTLSCAVLPSKMVYIGLTLCIVLMELVVENAYNKPLNWISQYENSHRKKNGKFLRGNDFSLSINNSSELNEYIVVYYNMNIMVSPKIKMSEHKVLTLRNPVG